MLVALHSGHVSVLRSSSIELGQHEENNTGNDGEPDRDPESGTAAQVARRACPGRSEHNKQTAGERDDRERSQQFAMRIGECRDRYEPVGAQPRARQQDWDGATGGKRKGGGDTAGDKRNGPRRSGFSFHMGIIILRAAECRS